MLFRSAAIPSAVNLATSGDVSVLQWTLESFSDRVDQIQLEVSRQRYANSRPFPERRGCNFTPESARGCTFERYKYDRHAYDVHDHRGSDHRDSSGDRTYSASHQRENYHAQSPRGSQERRQYREERDYRDRSSRMDPGKGDKSFEGYSMKRQSRRSPSPGHVRFQSPSRAYQTQENK